MDGNAVGKTFAKYISLNIIGMISASALVFIDAIFISIALGADGLTAISLTSPIFSLVFGLGLMLGEGGGSKYAALMAAEKEEKANAFFTISFRTCFIIAVPLVIAGIFFSELISTLLGAQGYILPMVAGYARVFLTFSPIVILYYALESFVRNDGSPGVAMVSSVIFYTLNIALDYIFIIEMGLGMFGSGLATVVASFCAVLYLFYHWYKKAHFHFTLVFVAAKKSKEIFAIGAPSLVGNLLTGLNILVFNLLFLRHLGNLGVAAFGIVSTLSIVVGAVFAGIAQGMQPMASHFFGKNDIKNMNKVLKYSVMTSLCIALFFIAVVFLFTEPIISILNREQDAVLASQLALLSINGVRIYFTAFIFVGVTLVSTYFLAATGAPKRALILSILQNGGIIPFVFLAAFIADVTGIWASYPVYEMLLLFVTVWFLIRANKSTSPI